jgi:hypothetical protein
MVRSYNVLVVDSSRTDLNITSEVIAKAGHVPIPCNGVGKAIDYLNGNYKNIAMIISDMTQKGSGIESYKLINARNHIDPTLPFYLYAGNPGGETIQFMTSSLFLNGYIKKPDERSIDFLIRNVLTENVRIKKPVAFFKFGGSADDFDIEQPPPARLETLNELYYLQQKQQVILTVGAGKIGDIEKTLYKKYASISKDFKEKFPYIMSRYVLPGNIATNMYILGTDRAIYIPFFELISKDVNLERLFDTDSIIILGAAPRHLSISRPEAANPENREYPNIPLQDSDAQTMLLAEYVGAKRVILIKRTDGIYLFDPYRGFLEGPEKWRETQKENRRIEQISCDELINGRLNGGDAVSREGAFDGMGEHLMETSALKLFKASQVIDEITVVHVYPQEMYVNGTHVVTGSKMPDTGKRLRRRMFNEAIGKSENTLNLSRITK